jgi:histidinol-phosphatase
MLPWEQELHVACAAARRAGALALRHQRAGVRAETKPDLSPVTVADRESERLIVEEISGAFPGDGFLGEEGGAKEGRSGRRWIIDPIDGTRDFVRGVQHWAVLIGLEEAGRVVVGVAYFPGLDRLYHASRGAGAFRDGEPIHVSDIASPPDALVCVNGMHMLARYPWSPRVLGWVAQFGSVRSFGGCMDAVLLASGQVDLWLEPESQPWDLAPLQIIVEEAGGRFFDFTGAPTIHGGNCVACVPGLEKVARSLLE